MFVVCGCGEAAQRLAVQPPQAHRKTCQKANDLAREAVGCNGGLGGCGVSSKRSGGVSAILCARHSAAAVPIRHSLAHAGRIVRGRPS